MAIARSRITAQGQVSVPAEVRKKLGAGPGSVLEWDEEDGAIVVRRKGRFSSMDIHKALFPNGPPKRRSLAQMDEGIKRLMRRRHARN
jgi:AbrB family looped-hinge helix DNA binding protein